MSLQDPSRKMSKPEHDGSNKGCIYLLNDLDVARKKIMSTVTDSYGKVKLDKVNQQGLYNLIEIACSLSNKTMEDIENEFKDKVMVNLKNM